MGQKGDKQSSEGNLAAEQFLEQMSNLEGVTSKKMFGGHGIFHDEKMFGIVDTQGTCYFKADDSNRDAFLGKGSTQHSRMPYFSIPSDVQADRERLIEWARQSIATNG